MFCQRNRSKVMQEFGISNPREVNKILGKQWNSMEDEERAEFYLEAKKIKEKHQRLHPQYRFKYLNNTLI